MSQFSQNKEHLRLAWLVWGLAAAFFFFDYMARVSPSVMHQYLQLAFGMNEAQFGVLTSSFYIPYILMQLPVGLMVDRASIRILLTIMSLLTALGCCIFGLSDGLALASFGRMLIGLSAAFAFVSALRLATSWFPPTMLGLLAGLTQALGMLGAASGQAPVSMLVSWVGWRHCMLIIACLFVVLAWLIYQFVQDKPVRVNTSDTDTEASIGILQSIKIVLSMPMIWVNALYAGFLYAPTAVIGESLGAAYLQYGQKMSAHVAAFAIGLIFIGWSIGGPIFGWASDRIGRRKPLMILSALSGLLLSSVIVFCADLSQPTMYILFFIFGFTNTGVGIAYALATELQARKVVGTTIALTNMASIFVGASLQPLVGRMVDAVAGERSYNVAHLLLSDFQGGLFILPICSLIAFILACFVKETYCKPLKVGG